MQNTAPAVSSRFRPVNRTVNVRGVLFLLKKILGGLLQPLPAVLWLWIFAGVLALLRRRRLAVLCAMVGAALLALCSNEGIADRLIFSLESRFPPVYIEAGQSLPAELTACRFIAVLGGGNNRDLRQAGIGRLCPASLGRLTEAVRLARLVPDARLLFCGAFIPENGDTHAEVLRAAATELGIDASRMMELRDVRDTHDEVREIRRVAGDAPIALVTSAWHMPRAVGLARHAGLHVLPAPSDFAVSPNGNPPGAWRRWSIAGLTRSGQAIHEYIGLLWTKLRGQR